MAAWSELGVWVSVDQGIDLWALARQARAGKSSAAEQLVLAIYPIARQNVLRFRKIDQESVVQDAITKVWREILKEDFEPTGTLEGLVSIVAQRLAIDAHRRRKRIKSEPVPEVVQDAENTDATLDGMNLLGLLEEFAEGSALCRRCARLIRMRIVEGLSWAQIVEREEGALPSDTEAQAQLENNYTQRYRRTAMPKFEAFVVKRGRAS
jgi:DNA-directed RNA polymerase specialized sigma24 family protein